MIENLKLDMKDMRILSVLDKDPTIPLSTLAKKVGVSKQVAEYRLKKLIEQKTVYGFFTVINLGSLGYSLYRAHIKLRKGLPEEYARLSESLFKNYPTFWVAFVSGSFDIIADIWARSSGEFHGYLEDILRNHKDIIFSYEVFPMLSLNILSYSYFLPEKHAKRKGTIFQEAPVASLDEKDRKILSAIKNNARTSYEEIGKHAHLTRNAVKRRILELEKEKVIDNYYMMVNFQHFKRLSYKIFISYDHAHIQQEKELLSFLESRQSVLAYARLLGKWNLDIELQPHTVKELQEFLIGLRNRFNLIQNYELIQIIEDFGLDFFPSKLSLK